MSLFSRSTTSAISALLIALALTLAAVLTITGQSSSANTSGVFKVDGTVYKFVPTVCTTTDSDFVAAGSGTIDGESFWVSATSRSMTLTVGTPSEVARPAEDDLWITSVGQVEWSSVDGRIDVAATMVDGRADEPTSHQATLSVACAASA